MFIEVLLRIGHIGIKIISKLGSYSLPGHKISLTIVVPI